MNHASLVTQPLPNDTGNENAQDQLNDLADEIEQYDLNVAGRLRTIADDVGTPNAARWIGVNLPAIIGMDILENQIMAHHRWQRGPVGFVLSGLEWIRNISVVVPILFTWVVLGFAATNYQTLVMTQPEARFDIFLLTGNPGYSVAFPWPVMTLTDIALWDALLLIFLALLTFIVHGQKDWLDNHAQNRARDIRSRLEAALWDISTSVLVSGKQDSDTALVHVQQILQRLLTEQDQANQLITNLQNIYVGLQNSISHLDNAAANLQNSLRGVEVGIDQSNKGLSLAAKSLETTGNQVQGATQGLANNVSQALQGISSGLTEIQNLQQAMSSIPQIVQSLENANVSLTQTSTQMRNNQTRFDDMQIIFQNTLQQIDNQVHLVLKNLGRVRGSQDPSWTDIGSVGILLFQLILIIGVVIFWLNNR